MEKKVWLISHCGPENIGGCENATNIWVTELIRRGANVTWLYPDRAKYRLDKNSNPSNEQLNVQVLETVNFPKIRRLVIPTTTSQIHFHRMYIDQKPDTIILNGYCSPLFQDTLLASIRFCRRQPNIFHIFHGELGISPDLSPLTSLRRQIISQLHFGLVNSFRNVKYIAVSESTRQQLLRSRFFSPDTNIDVVYPSSPDACSQRRPEPDNNQNSFVATTVSRLSPGKGIETLIDLATQAKKRNLPFQFNLVGPAHHQPYLDQTTAMFQGIVNLIGQKTGQDLCLSYLNSDLSVMSSPAEGFGLVTVEALNHGVPVLATQIPATEEIFRHFNHLPGFLIPRLPNRSFDLNTATDFMSRFAQYPQLRSDLYKVTEPSRRIFNSTSQTNRLADLVLG